MAYQISPDFQSILDFATLSHHKQLMEQELEASIAMASFKADAAKVASATSSTVDATNAIMDLRNKMAALDVSNPLDKIVYDSFKKRLDKLL